MTFTSKWYSLVPLFHDFKQTTHPVSAFSGSRSTSLSLFAGTRSLLRLLWTALYIRKPVLGLRNIKENGVYGDFLDVLPLLLQLHTLELHGYFSKRVCPRPSHVLAMIIRHISRLISNFTTLEQIDTMPVVLQLSRFILLHCRIRPRRSPSRYQAYMATITGS